MKRSKLIGFDRRLELDWLDMAADCVNQGLSQQDSTDRLRSYLSKRIPNIPAQKKTLTVLQGIWIKVPESLYGLRDSGAMLLKNNGKSVRLPIHYGMCLASYPFFGSVVHQIGRLNRLQGEIKTSQVKRRVVEKYGDTERVRRSVRHVVQSLNTWQVLQMVKPGLYTINKPNDVFLSEIRLWLIEALLHSQDGKGLSVSDVRDENRLFPFIVNSSASELSKNPRLTITRQNVDSELITLR